MIQNQKVIQKEKWCHQLLSILTSKFPQGQERSTSVNQKKDRHDPSEEQVETGIEDLKQIG